METGSDFAKTWGTEPGEYDAVIIPRLLRRHAARRRQTVLRLCQGRSDLQRRHRTFAQHAARRGRLVDGQELRPRAGLRRRPAVQSADGFAAPRLRRDPRPAQTRFSSKTPRRSLSETSAWRLREACAPPRCSIWDAAIRFRGNSISIRAPTSSSHCRDSMSPAGISPCDWAEVSAGTPNSPTMDSLYPDTEYFDFTQLNYWPANPALRRINLRLYTLDPTNYDPACRTQFQMGGSPRRRLERQPAVGDLFPRRHDVGIPHDVGLSELHLPGLRRNGDRHGTVGRSPVARRHPLYGRDAVGRVLPLDQRQPHGKSRASNSPSPRSASRAIATQLPSRAPISGRTTQHAPRVPAADLRPRRTDPPSVGYYFRRTVTCAKCCNTNFLLDTQIPRLKLILSTSFQCMWFLGNRNTPVSAWPISYLDEDLVSHPFTAESAADGFAVGTRTRQRPTLWRYITTRSA